MVDFKLLLNPPVARNDLLRHRCRSENKNVSQIRRFCTVSCRDENKELICRESENRCKIQKRYIFGTITVLLLLAYYIHFFPKKEEASLRPPNPTKPLPPSASRLRVFRKAAVCADGHPCANVGRIILEKNGSAVDAAIASLFCTGVLSMQSMGLGGGFLMTIYKRDEKKAYFLNARETAPLNAHNELYKTSKVSKTGPLSVAVPGEVKGYWAAHKKFGKLPWKEIIQPSLEMCERGYDMSDHQYRSLFIRSKLHDDPNFREWFYDSEGNFKKTGSKIVPKKLCQTLKLLAENGGDDFYTGIVSKMFLKDLTEIGGVITSSDLDKYQAQWMEPVHVQFRNEDHLYSAPLPGSGVLLAFMLNILDGYGFDRSSLDSTSSTVATYHKIIEAFKYAYARRTELGDMNFGDMSNLINNLTSREYADHIRLKIKDGSTCSDHTHYGAVFYTKEDRGTAHLSILAPNGDAVSVTSSINFYFGAGCTSKRTGIIFNSHMDDFSFPHYINYFGLPGSPSNQMVPGKRPLSSMCPSIITDKNGDVKMVVGAAGGTRITTTVAQTIMRALWFGDNIKEAVDAPRLHHQLFPMEVEYEYGTLQTVLDGLQALGHKVKRNSASVVCALLREDGKISGNADYRKGGDVNGIGIY